MHVYIDLFILALCARARVCVCVCVCVRVRVRMFKNEEVVSHRLSSNIGDLWKWREGGREGVNNQ